MNQFTQRHPSLGLAAFLLAVMALVIGSGAAQVSGDEPATGAAAAEARGAGQEATLKATGSVEIVWPGGHGRDVPPGEEKLAFAEFVAFPGRGGKVAHGEFTYRVLNADGTLHREIVAEVRKAYVKPVNDDSADPLKAWFVADVISDVRLCSGCGGDDGGCGDDGGTHDDGGCSGSGGTGGSGGPDGGCGDDGGTHDDGGCSGSGGTGGSGGTDGGCGDDGTHDDGGCSGSGGTGGSGGTDGGCGDDGGTHDDGGCGDDGTHDDGGCSGSGGTGGSGGTDGGCGDDGGTHDDGGCSGSGGTGGSGGTDGGCGDDGTHDDGGCGDDGTHDDGGCSGSGGTGGSGGHISGKESRVGQYVIVKVHDKATPGEPGDGITWKWFAPDNARVAAIMGDISDEPTSLCKKTIIGGNLVVHIPKK